MSKKRVLTITELRAKKNPSPEAARRVWRADRQRFLRRHPELKAASDDEVRAAMEADPLPVTRRQSSHQRRAKLRAAIAAFVRRNPALRALSRDEQIEAFLAAIHLPRRRRAPRG